MYLYVDDKGDYFDVNGVYDKVQKGSFQNYKLNGDQYKKIKSYLKQNKRVSFIKLDKIEIDIDDMLIDNTDLDLFKLAKIQQIKNNISKGVISNKKYGASIEFALESYKVSQLLNMFMNSGVKLSDDRHDTYLQILETENDNLIDRLEEYLEYYDDVNKRSSILSKHIDLCSKIEKTDDKSTIASYVNVQLSYDETEL